MAFQATANNKKHGIAMIHVQKHMVLPRYMPKNMVLSLFLSTNHGSTMVHVKYMASPMPPKKHGITLVCLWYCHDTYTKIHDVTI